MMKFGVYAWPAFSTRDINPYNYLIYSKIKEKGYPVYEFSISKNNILKSVFSSKYKILHIHWPVNHILYGSGKWQACRRLFTFYLFIKLIRFSNKKIVWTVHNLDAHESRFPDLEKLLNRILYKHVDGFISMNQSGIKKIRQNLKKRKYERVVYIPHPHYKDYYTNELTKAEARQKLKILPGDAVFLFLGQMRAYKNLPLLIKTFKQLPLANKVLLIAGSLHKEVQEEIIQLTEGDTKYIRLYDAFVKDEDLQVFLNAADLVVTPYKKVFNSGSVILNLSFKKPTLAPELYSLAELKEEIGEQWIKTYRQELSSEILLQAMHEAIAEEKQRGEPDISFLDPEEIAKKTIEFYKVLINDQGLPLLKKFFLKLVNFFTHVKHFRVEKRYRYYISDNYFSRIYQLKYYFKDYFHKRKYKIIEYQGEFQQELCFVLPFTYWHHLNGTLKKTVSSKSTKEFYFFSGDHEEVYEKRIWQYNRKNFEFPNMTHCVSFSYSKWARVPLKKHYSNTIFCFEKPILVIANKYNIEWDNKPLNFLDIPVLERIIEMYKDKYQIIYNRPLSEQIIADNSDILDLKEFYWLKEKYPTVLLMQDLFTQHHLSVHNFNHLQMLVYANCSHFVSVHGGAATLASYFGGTNIIFSKSGMEHIFHEFATIFPALSGARILHAQTTAELFDFLAKHY